MKKIISLIFALSAIGAQAQNLTKAQASALADELRAGQKVEAIEKYGAMWDGLVMQSGTWRMPIGYGIYGAKPADGRSLWISMHGGGNTTAQANTQQWRNQLRLYAPAEGVYVVPRAAVDDWNMWFRPHVDSLFGAIIQTAVAKYDVNPDKVYIMGYSAGGDGVYRLAPRMADHWAAAAMMAGHPGEASPLNLRNVPFTLWMGQNDAAYDRNKLAVEFGARMDSLRAADPDGYVHSTHIVADKGHWMDRADTVAVAWMARFRRGPYPARVVWRQEESHPRTAFYYLSIPETDAVAGREVRVERRGNSFDIARNDHPVLRIWLNDAMVDMEKPVTVRFAGKRIFRGRVARRAEHMRRTARERMDGAYIFSGCIELADGKAEVVE